MDALHTMHLQKMVSSSKWTGLGLKESHPSRGQELGLGNRGLKAEVHLTEGQEELRSGKGNDRLVRE